MTKAQQKKFVEKLKDHFNYQYDDISNLKCVENHARKNDDKLPNAIYYYLLGIAYANSDFILDEILNGKAQAEKHMILILTHQACVEWVNNYFSEKEIDCTTLFLQ